MKNFCITLSAFAIIILIIIAGVYVKEPTHTEYLRIHVRANSNNEEDQAVKLKVKNAVVEYMIPFVADCKSKTQAQKVVKKIIPNLIKVAEETLREGGFNYGAKASVKNEKFPTRIYNGITLNGGLYDALILELGSGKGDNWWCVVYPPLCFTGVGDVKYASKIYQVIKDFLSNYKREEKWKKL